MPIIDKDQITAVSFYAPFVKLENAVPGVGKTPHDRGAAGGVGCGDLLPDHRAHVIEPDGLAEFDDLRPDGNDLVPAIVNRAGKESD